MAVWPACIRRGRRAPRGVGRSAQETDGLLGGGEDAARVEEGAAKEVLGRLHRQLRVQQRAVVHRLRQLLERVGLSERLTHRPAELSGGERQRTSVVRSLINQPRLLLCDEPTGNLDSASAESLGDLFLELAKDENVALVVVTHSEELADRFDVTYRLKDGALESNA